MAEINDGGPAFATPHTGSFDNGDAHDTRIFYGGNDGMSLRDWFAGQALSGLLQVCTQDTLADGPTYGQHISKNAYDLADTMLAERAKTGGAP